MIVDIAARAGRQDLRGIPRLGHALVAAVTESAICEPAVRAAALSARAKPGPQSAVVVQTEHGAVTARAPHPSTVVLDLPCDAEAGLLFRARAARGGAAVAAAADLVDSGNLHVSALRGALAAFAEHWPRELVRVDAAACGAVVTSALPFLQAVRCDGLGETASGPVVSLRLLSEPDERPLAWTTKELGPAPKAGAGKAGVAAVGAPFLELFTDSVFQARFSDAAHRAFAMQAHAGHGLAHINFREMKFDVLAWGEHLVLKCPLFARLPDGAAPWMVRRQLEDPRVALHARLALAASLMSGAARKAPVLAARAAGIGEIDEIRVWGNGPDCLELRFKRDTSDR